MKLKIHLPKKLFAKSDITINLGKIQKDIKKLKEEPPQPKVIVIDDDKQEEIVRFGD